MDWYIRDTNVPGVSDAFVFKAVDIETGAVVGHISLGGLSWKNRSSRISRVLVSPDAMQKGICQYMTKAVLKIGFEELGLHRIGLGVYENNKAALNCYLKSGLPFMMRHGPGDQVGSRPDEEGQCRHVPAKQGKACPFN